MRQTHHHAHHQIRLCQEIDRLIASDFPVNTFNMISDAGIELGESQIDDDFRSKIFLGESDAWSNMQCHLMTRLISKYRHNLLQNSSRQIHCRRVFNVISASTTRNEAFTEDFLENRLELFKILFFQSRPHLESVDQKHQQLVEHVNGRFARRPVRRHQNAANVADTTGGTLFDDLEDWH